MKANFFIVLGAFVLSALLSMSSSFAAEKKSTTAPQKQEQSHKGHMKCEDHDCEEMHKGKAKCDESMKAKCEKEGESCGCHKKMDHGKSEEKSSQEH